ncbi:MAG: SpoIIE family protein phosphatase [Bacteroidia bacterium]|nr:SpoIIE family protein phosphatase [Bacteroidia bacterium]
MLSSISPESFLVYKAQKIVSGDFYMFEKRDQQSVIIMGDSTGHGVSASYISLMILNILNRVLKFSFYCPATVLEMLHLEILSTTSLNNANPIIECADMGMCFIDHEKMTMEYALARGKGIILRDGKVIQLEREKCSVGAQECNEIKLKRNVINLLKGDQLYLYSDGITDQFGGPFGKKIGNKKLLEILKSNSSFSMETQKNFILKELASWQGNYEQTDDISLIGLKII